jgi:hypothetical protein
MTAVKAGRTGTSGRLAGLTSQVGGYELAGLKLALSERSTRLTTVVTLHGAGHRALPISAPSGDRPLGPTRSTWPFAQAVLNLAALPDDSGRGTLARVQRRVAARLGAARRTSSGSAPCCA